MKNLLPKMGRGVEMLGNLRSSTQRLSMKIDIGTFSWRLVVDLL